MNSRIDESSRAYYQTPLDGNFSMAELQQNQIENHPTSVYSYSHSTAQTGTGFPMAELQPAQVDSRQPPASMYYPTGNFNVPHHFQSTAAAVNQAENRQIYYSSIGGQPQSAEFLMSQFQSSQDPNRMRPPFWY